MHTVVLAATVVMLAASAPSLSHAQSSSAVPPVPDRMLDAQWRCWP